MSKSSANSFLRKALGEEGVAELRKYDLYKLSTNTVVDHEEIKTALQIVPRTILSLLQSELAPMNSGSGKEFKLPIDNAFLRVTKMANDVYTGEIRKGADIVAKFTNRSLPGIGLVVMTTFELYDVKDIVEDKKDIDSSHLESKIQSLIDERLNFHSMVSKVVDQKISEREALDSLIRMKLTQAVLSEAPKEKTDPKKLKKFLDSRKKDPEYKIEMAKSESVSCPDCRKVIFSDSIYSGCVCLGADMTNTVFVKKSETGYSMRFPQSWDQENIQMFLDTVRNRGNV